MNYNYHTHTYRCSHATGTEEEYIQRAMDNGIEFMGFSDHAPLKFSDGYESGFRVPTAAVDEYVDTLKQLRKRYEGKIEITIGFEMEYYPDLFEAMFQFVKAHGAEYLILGQHFVDKEYPEQSWFSLQRSDSVDKLKAYVERVVSGIKTGVFTYVAHPDVINFSGDDTVYKEEVRKICSASKQYNIPLEINFLGIRDNRNYPTELFWETAGEEGAPVTFGLDSHTVDSAYDGDSLKRAEELVEKYKLNYIGKPTIISLR